MVYLESHNFIHRDLVSIWYLGKSIVGATKNSLLYQYSGLSVNFVQQQCRCGAAFPPVDLPS